MVLVSKTKKNSFHKFIQEEVNEIDLYNKDQEPEDKYNLSEIKLAIALSAKILKGNYINTREGERIYFHEKHFVKLYEASSGQQEALWIINLIYLLLWKDAFSSELFTNFTIIEEPEAHLYPETQRDVTNLISLLANQPGNQVMITTHSPYILSALNNLLYAHKAGKTKPDEVSEIVDPLLWLNLSPDRVAAYKVENGEIHDIIDPELGMINAEEIDSASRTIFDELDKILQLED